MAHCCNCGTEIPDSDRTRLCDPCKKIILPFVKFMDASTSSAVRRLVSNEQNLRHAGVTDGGMDYLMRICELHDKQKMQERKEREEAKQPQNIEQIPQEISPETEKYTEEELPMDEPLNLRRKPYGVLLPVAEALLIAAGIVLLGLCIANLIILQEFDVLSLAGGIGALAAAYAADTTRKLLHDLGEIKKQFR